LVQMALRSLCRLRQLSRGVDCLLHASFVQHRIICVPLPSSRRFSSFVDDETERKAKIEQERQESEDKRKVRRAYALGGCLIAMWLSTHAILLYRRRSEFRSLNDKLPPIEWEEFKKEYLEKGLVKTVVFQPHFEVGNVYLHSPQENALKKKIVDVLHAAPDKFSRPPDVRFVLESSGKDAKRFFDDVIREAGVEGAQFELDEFPSYRELSFILASSVFAVAAVALMK
ncbi:hypothetical protein PFISCL1PPCAC_16302, partial [Pristionchus fissidentatus]